MDFHRIRTGGTAPLVTLLGQLEPFLEDIGNRAGVSVYDGESIGISRHQLGHYVAHHRLSHAHGFYREDPVTAEAELIDHQVGVPASRHRLLMSDAVELHVFELKSLLFELLNRPPDEDGSLLSMVARDVHKDRDPRMRLRIPNR